MRADYDRIFEAERINTYPAVDEFEARVGHAIDKDRLEEAARILACPLKVNPPNWQHGRIVYAALRRYLEKAESPVTLLDVGTAKGFSALCMAFALHDAGVEGSITSLDVIDPQARVTRNSVADLGQLKTVRELVSPWMESKAIAFLQSPGVSWLKSSMDRVHFAFIDGKHSYEAVRDELRLLAERQKDGDIAICDDLQIPGIHRAVVRCSNYRFEFIEAKADRKYAIGTRI